MRCWFAKRSRTETDPVLRGSATASGVCSANHLSPACCSSTAFSKLTSPGGSSLLSWERRLYFLRIIGRTVRGQEFFRIRCFFVRHLHEDASGGQRVTIHAQSRKLVGDDRVKFCRFESRTHKVGVGGIESTEDSDELHRNFQAAKDCLKSANTMTPAPVWRRLCTCTSTWWPTTVWALLTTTIVPSGK